MDSDIGQKKFTDQGRDTLDPVELASVQTGSPRPSASYCKTPPVFNQAGGAAFATGEKESEIKRLEEEIFRKSTSTPRTPEEKTNGAGNEEDDVVFVDTALNVTGSPEEQVTEDNKRKRTERNEYNMKEEMAYLREVLKETTKTIAELNMLVKENPNTKKEIKTKTTKLSLYATRLSSEKVRNLLNQVEESGRPEKAARKEEKLPAKKVGKSIGTQTSEDDLKTKQYKKTTIKEGNPLTNADNEWDLVVFRSTKDPNMENGIQKMFKEKYGEVQRTKGDIGHIMVATWVLGKDESEDELTTKHVFRIDEAEDMKDNRKKLEIVKERLIHNNRTKVAIAWDDIKKAEQLREELKEMLQETDLYAAIHVPYTKTKPPTNPTKSFNSQAIFVKGDANKSYADLLKDVKNEVLSRGLQEQVQGVRETKNGEMIIALRKVQNIDRIKEALTNKLGKERVRTKSGQREALFHVRDIDAISLIQEVEEAIIKVFQPDDKTRTIKVTSLKPSHAGTQTAFVAVGKLEADILRQLKTVQIGMSDCRIKERINVESCYKCWQQGHNSRDCTGVDRSKACRNGGEDGHIKKECSNNSKCVICDKEGHQTNTTRCLVFRQAIQDRENKDQTPKKDKWGRETEWQRTPNKTKTQKRSPLPDTSKT